MEAASLGRKLTLSLGLSDDMTVTIIDGEGLGSTDRSKLGLWLGLSDGGFENGAELG